MRRPSLLPTKPHASIVTAIYARADAEGWDALGPRDRSRLYSQWINEPDIGGVLTRFLTPEAARSWIKDGPMKEYARANRGAGRYAEFGKHGGTSPGDIIRVALGDGAKIEPGTARLKPFNCLAREPGGDLVYVTWGEARNFRDLLWAATNAATFDTLPAHIVVMEPPGHVIPSDDKKHLQALADRCDIQLHHMREILGTRRPVTES